jgi:hypothetical protein
MKTIVAALLLLFLLGITTHMGAAAGTAVGPPTIWHPVDPSSSPH